MLLFRVVLVCRIFHNCVCFYINTVVASIRHILVGIISDYFATLRLLFLIIGILWLTDRTRIDTLVAVDQFAYEERL